MNGGGVTLEINSFIDVYNSQSRIIEAMLRAHELENQYRAQGYSEAQIQQFHEGVKDWVSDKWNKTKAWTKGKKDAAGKFIDDAGGVWGAIKKLAGMVMTWIKKVFLRIFNIFSDDKKIIVKYKKVLLDNEEELKNIKVPCPEITVYKDPERESKNLFNKSMFDIDAFYKSLGLTNTSGTSFNSTELEIKWDSKMPAEYDQLTDKLNDDADTIKQAYYPLNECYGSVKNLIGHFESFGSINEIKTEHNFLVTKLTRVANEHDPDPLKARTAKAYINFVQTYFKYKTKVLITVHGIMKHAILTCVAHCKKKPANETAMIIQEFLIKDQYAIETVLMETAQIDQILNSF